MVHSVRAIIFTIAWIIMQEDFTLSSYSYHLPEQLIAQHPAEKRDNSRLMVVHAGNKELQHCRFSDICRFIGKNDMLVVNNTRVFPARLLGTKETGGKAEVFLLEFPVALTNSTAVASALIKSSKRPKVGTRILINEMLSCFVQEDLDNGKMRLRLHYGQVLGLAETLQRSGQVPLPPYISRKDGSTAEDVNRYQTVYASQPGAVAAPTAGLHFTDELLTRYHRPGHFAGTCYPACRVWHLCPGAGNGHHPTPDPPGISQYPQGNCRKNSLNQKERGKNLGSGNNNSASS